MTFIQRLELADIETEIANERYQAALEANEHPEILDNLITQASLAPQRLSQLENIGLAA